MALTLPPLIYSQNKQIPNFSRLLVSEPPIDSFAVISQPCILRSPPSLPCQARWTLFPKQDLKDLDFACKGIEETTMPKAELVKEETIAISSLSLKPSAVLLSSFPTPPTTPPTSSTKTSTLSSSSTICLPPPLISSPKTSTPLASSLIVSVFPPLIGPLISSSSSSPSSQSFSTTTPFSQSFKPHCCSKDFRIVDIAPDQHHITIRLGTLQYNIPPNHLMWHPVGHIVLLKTLIYTDVLDWRRYFGLLKHMFQVSGGGIHRFRLEDLGNEQWRVEGGYGVCLDHADDLTEYTWEVRALLAWEKACSYLCG